MNIGGSSLIGGSLIPIDGNSRALTEEEVLLRISDLRKEWRIMDYGSVRKLESGYAFSTYEDACRFVGLVSRLCREHGYAPDITFGKDYAFLAFFTHAINGLHDNDFVMAAKIDEMLSE